MSYVVLARKWRPMTFEDLVGQEHVSRTLANAIQSGRIAHAFLFTGVRGVGKTTSARILAKALNCMGTPEAPRSGPTVTPCLKCAACIEITAGTDMDVREIDGASYTGIDDVRKLQESMPYRPARDRYKIFIVDEVHMLSQQAWNAFLKTLEEPPPHVKFIFATTEVHKVPITILSRVQRFDFKLIPTQLITKRLKHVLTTEGIAADDAALSIIGREAAGSMRDAMSLLDQVIAWNDQALDGDSVSRALGVASRKVLHDMAAALVAGDAARCLDITASLANQGYEVMSVCRDLLALLRDLVVAKVCSNPGDLLDLADEERADVQTLSARADTDDLLRLHQGFSAGFDEVARSADARAALEMLLVRLARRPPLLPIDDLLTRLAALEKRLGGAPPRAPGAPAAPTGNRGAPPTREGRSQEPVRPQRREPRTAESSPRAPAPEPSEEPPRAELPSAPRAAPDSAISEWKAIVDRVRVLRPELAACLHHAVIIEVSKNRVALGFESGTVFERAVREPDALQALTLAAREHFEAEPTIVLQSDTNGAAGTTVSAVESRERAERQRSALAKAKEHPRIAEAASILGAKLKEIRLREE